jgi:hypothetical protein
MKRHAVVDSLCAGCTQRKAKFCTSWREKNRLPSWLTKSSHFEVQCLLQAMILVHVYRFTKLRFLYTVHRFTNLDSCARMPIYKPWFLCTFTDLQTLILVHVYRFTNLYSCVLFTDLQESDLLALTCVHLLPIQKESDYVYRPLLYCQWSSSKKLEHAIVL